MKYLLTIALLFHLCFIRAQNSNLIFFTEEGENFTLYVNGAKYNDIPVGRVTAEGIIGDFAQVKIEFKEAGAPVLKKSLLLDQGNEMTTVIKKNKKGKYVFRPVSSVPIPESGTVAITPPTEPSYYASGSSDGNFQATSTSGSSGSSVGINVRAGEESFGLNVNVEGFEGETQSSTVSGKSANSQNVNQISARVEGKNIILSDGRTYNFSYVRMNNFGARLEVKNPVGARATISYDGVQAYSGEIPFLYDEKDWKKGNDYFKITVEEPAGTWSVKLKYSNGNKMVIDGDPVGTSTPQPTVVERTGCTTPMSAENFDRSKSSISNKSFSDEKMTVYRQIVRASCLSVSQVVSFMDLFTYEEEKLEVAKLGYPKTVDKGNYYQVNDALTFLESVEALEKFLENQ